MKEAVGLGEKMYSYLKDDSSGDKKEKKDKKVCYKTKN